MKKILLAVAFLFFAGISYASTLQISVSDALTDTNLNGEQGLTITLSEKPANFDPEEDVYKITDYTPTDGQVLTITKGGYLDSVYSLLWESNELHYCQDEPNNEQTRVYTCNYVSYDKNTYSLDLLLFPPRQEIIRGKILAQVRDYEITPDIDNLELTVYDEFGVATVKINDNLTYEVQGYLGTKDLPRKYTLKLSRRRGCIKT